jgi:hypothetical protein
VTIVAQYGRMTTTKAIVERSAPTIPNGSAYLITTSVIGYHLLLVGRIPRLECATIATMLTTAAIMKEASQVQQEHTQVILGTRINFPL